MEFGTPCCARCPANARGFGRSMSSRGAKPFHSSRVAGGRASRPGACSRASSRWRVCARRSSTRSQNRRRLARAIAGEGGGEAGVGCQAAQRGLARRQATSGCGMPSRALQFAAGGKQEAALAAPEDLAVLDAEAADGADGAGPLPVRAVPAACAASSTTVSPVLGCERRQGRRVSHPAPQVHRDDRPGPRGDLAGRVIIMQVQGGRVAVDEYRYSPKSAEGGHGHDDVSAGARIRLRADAAGGQCGVQGRGTGGDRDDVRYAEHLGQVVLQLPGERTAARVGHPPEHDGQLIRERLRLTGDRWEHHGKPPRSAAAACPVRGATCSRSPG